MKKKDFMKRLKELGYCLDKDMTNRAFAAYCKLVE